jgi:hypothetical protein
MTSIKQLLLFEYPSTSICDETKFINESLKVKIAKKLYPDQGYPIFDL